jgi:PhnB protein
VSDPFDQLRLPVEARHPRSAFARQLRELLLAALDLDAEPGVEVTDTSRRTAMTDTTTQPAATATGLQAYLAVHDGAAAIDFYQRAFGAVEVFRVVGDDGRLGHAELTVGPVRLMLSDEYPEFGASSPATLGGSAVLLHLEVTDCDAVHARAVGAGATTLRPPEDQSHGNRTATIADPFGHRWMLSQPVEAVDLDEYAARESGGYRVEAGPGGGGRAAPSPTVWPCVNCVDARDVIGLLVDTFGFSARLVVADDLDPSIVHHAELAWPEGGGVMVGTADREGGAFAAMPTGAASCYVVSARVDELYQRARDAGLAIVRELRDEEYGSHGFSVRDAEGNIWSFGTYPGT